MFFIISTALKCLRKGNVHQQSHDLETGRLQGDCSLWTFLTRGLVESQMNKKLCSVAARTAWLKTKLNIATLGKGLL